jgi:hypothetical protein
MLLAVGGDVGNRQQLDELADDSLPVRGDVLLDLRARLGRQSDRIQTEEPGGETRAFHGNVIIPGLFVFPFSFFVSLIGLPLLIHHQLEGCQDERTNGTIAGNFVGSQG